MIRKLLWTNAFYNYLSFSRVKKIRGIVTKSLCITEFLLNANNGRGACAKLRYMCLTVNVVTPRSLDNVLCQQVNDILVSRVGRQESNRRF